MTDRFDLEQSIMECWRVCDDVNILCENVMDKEMSVDDISNVLIGINGLYQLKFEKLFDQFCELVSKGNIK